MIIDAKDEIPKDFIDIDAEGLYTFIRFLMLAFYGFAGFYTFVCVCCVVKLDFAGAVI